MGCAYTVTSWTRFFDKTSDQFIKKLSRYFAQKCSRLGARLSASDGRQWDTVDATEVASRFSCSNEVPNVCD